VRKPWLRVRVESTTALTQACWQFALWRLLAIESKPATKMTTLRREYHKIKGKKHTKLKVFRNIKDH
jgi:hypothetical protein